ncbi:MAG: DUF4421 family protein, partial [Bdellovibrionales bacterium]
MRVTTFLTIMLGCNYLVFSQASDLLATEEKERAPIIIKFGGAVPALNIEAKTIDSSSTPINYRPSTQAKTFVSFDYDKYGISLSGYNPRTSEFRKKFGEGSALDFQFRFDWEPLYIETYYQQYKGYYLENANEVMPSPFGSNGEYPSNSSLEAKHIGVQIFKYKNRENFHPHQSLLFIDRAQKSGGSGFYSVSLQYHEARSSQSIVPTTAFDNYGELANWQESSVLTASIGGGGAYSLVLREKWVLSGLIGFGIGQQSSLANYANDKENEDKVVFKSQVKLAAGYTTEKFISGLNIQYDSTQIRLQSTEIVLS